ncbi:hypothetical protein MKW92_020777, partial [Papaver armeniacum]
MDSSGRLGIRPYGNFLKIGPTELKFPSYLHLTNESNENVAFSIKTTNWMKFFAKPSRGIIPPRTTYRITVVMDVWKETPRCIDTFLVQSFIAPKGAKEKDITPEMFEMGSGKVQEFVLKGIYVPVAPEGSSHRASGVENDEVQGSCVLDA